MSESSFKIIDYKGQKIFAKEVKLANGETQWRNRFNMALDKIDWVDDQHEELQQKATQKRQTRPKKKVADESKKGN